MRLLHSSDEKNRQGNILSLLCRTLQHAQRLFPYLCEGIWDGQDREWHGVIGIMENMSVQIPNGMCLYGSGSVLMNL